MGCLCPDTNSYYDALQAKLTRRFGGSSSIGAAYTFSKAINSIDNEEVGGTFGVNGGFLFWPHPSVKNRNKALASYDRTHNLSIYGGYELPFGPKKRWAQSGILGKIAGGWQVNWLMQRMSGSMITLGGGGAQVNAPGNLQTPDQIAPLHIIGGVGPLPGQPSLRSHGPVVSLLRPGLIPRRAGDLRYGLAPLAAISSGDLASSTWMAASSATSTSPRG